MSGCQVEKTDCQKNECQFNRQKVSQTGSKSDNQRQMQNLDPRAGAQVNNGTDSQSKNWRVRQIDSKTDVQKQFQPGNLCSVITPGDLQDHLEYCGHHRNQEQLQVVFSLWESIVEPGTDITQYHGLCLSKSNRHSGSYLR